MNILISNTYIRPRASYLDLNCYINETKAQIKKANNNSTRILLIGDFNATLPTDTDSKWSTEIERETKNYTNIMLNRGKKIKTLMRMLNLTDTGNNNEPTYYNINRKSRIDLILTGRKITKRVIDSHATKPIGNISHALYYISIKTDQRNLSKQIAQTTQPNTTQRTKITHPTKMGQTRPTTTRHTTITKKTIQY